MMMALRHSQESNTKHRVRNYSKTKVAESVSEMLTTDSSYSLLPRRIPTAIALGASMTCCSLAKVVGIAFNSSIVRSTLYAIGPLIVYPKEAASEDSMATAQSTRYCDSIAFLFQIYDGRGDCLN